MSSTKPSSHNHKEEDEIDYDYEFSDVEKCACITRFILIVGATSFLSVIWTFCTPSSNTLSSTASSSDTDCCYWFDIDCESDTHGRPDNNSSMNLPEILFCLFFSRSSNVFFTRYIPIALISLFIVTPIFYFTVNCLSADTSYPNGEAVIISSPLRPPQDYSCCDNGRSIVSSIGESNTIPPPSSPTAATTDTTVADLQASVPMLADVDVAIINDLVWHAMKDSTSSRSRKMSYSY